MKKMKMIHVILILFILLEVIYMFRFEIKDATGKIFCRQYTLDELTEEQKLADFETLYTNIVQSVPYLDDVKELYGIDFEGRKKYYLDEIKNTTNNVEFYGVMKAISRDTASFHTDVCFPLYSSLKGMKCYHSQETVHRMGMEAKMDAWCEELAQKAYEYENINLFCVRYVDGKYILKEGWLSEAYKDMAGYELISVDDTPAGQYVVNHLSIYRLGYDSLRDMAYRENYLFNDSVGKEVKTVWRTPDGHDIEQTMYVNKGVEVTASYGYLFSDRYQYYAETPYSDIETKRDDLHQLEYIKINNFENRSGKELQEYIANATYDKIVIDMRDNYGGQNDYAQKYVYPGMYKDDTTFEYRWKVSNTEQNKKMTGLLLTKLLYLDTKDDDFYYYSNVLHYEGKADEDKEIFYLVGSETGSAADAYIAMVKQNGLGTIVGTNTGGEGLGASYICDSLDNSSLVYVYYPSVLLEENADCPTAIWGTDPDVYIDQSTEDYLLYEKMRIEGTDSLYESRLEYDTVLKWVIEQ